MFLFRLNGQAVLALPPRDWPGCIHLDEKKLTYVVIAPDLATRPDEIDFLNDISSIGTVFSN
jgi:hypothetical protein